ncbi:hypothetical protein AGMMS50239_25440 [Bacteroidia bacterium]|nr:hypothetical protein AGMMS50239_25440 [Bacteroidia bacterium]
MASNLDPVFAEVSVAGKAVHFTYLKLEQSFNAHHHCEIHTDCEEFGLWMDEPVDIINYIGKNVNITFKHRQSGEESLFLGTITHVNFTGYHGRNNSVVITAASPTVKLAGKPAMDSFMDLPLQQVVQEAVSNSGNGCPVIVNPKFGSKLDFCCQYNENCFDFLNRLSWQFNEWFFYNGLDCCFGEKSGKSAKIEYDKEMTFFDLSANLVPQKFTRQHYLKHDSREIDKEDPSDIPGVRGYLQVSKRRSESVYTSEAVSPLMPDINTKKDIDDLVKAEKSRAVGGMLVMHGKTQTCKVKIGGAVKIMLPSKMNVAVKDVDRFLVTNITQIIDQEGHYSNEFFGIIDGIEAIPMEEPKMPIAMPQIATVKEDVDPRERGLVKVQFQWQKRKNKTTNWIRVATLDAGKSDIVSKNRGHVFIPEIDDLVMVGFEYGDPSRPYVAGSIFKENVSKGGGIDNNIKSIITRSGHTIEFNDTKNAETIKIKDKNSNEILYDTRSKTITVSTLEQINLVSKTIKIDAKEDVYISAGRDMQVSVGNDFTQAASGESRISVGKSSVTSVEKDLETKSGRNTHMESGKNMDLKVAEKLRQEADNSVDIISVGDKLNLSSKGKMTLKSNVKVHVANG